MYFQVFLACYFCVVCTALKVPVLGWNFPSIQLPSFGMNMPFPSLFDNEDPIGNMDVGNPDELMNREFSMPEMPTYQYSFGNFPKMKFNNSNNETTTNRTVKHEDGYKIVTTETKFPGGQSLVQTMEKEGGKNSTDKSFSVAKMAAEEENLGKVNKFLPFDAKKDCKNCGENQFCDPFFGKCQKKLSAGSTCAMKNQCEKGLMCVWGKCNKGKQGDAGTFCKKKEDCSGDACCIKKPGKFHALCIPRADEGAVCGNRMEGWLNLFAFKGNEKNSCEPCKGELKCAATGDSTYKRCLPKSFEEEPVSKPKSDNANKNKSKEDKDDDESDSNGEEENDEEEGSSDDEKKNENENKLTTNSEGKIPIKTGPKKAGSSKKKKKKGSKKNQ